MAAGKPVCDLTVGDFSPRQFPIPVALKDGIVAALEHGETNYPPSNGLGELREAVRRFYARELGLEYPVESVVITGGSRPAIYATYRTLVDPGDRVVYPVPSWNNNHYVHLTGAVAVPIRCGPAERFLPRPEDVRPAACRARASSPSTRPSTRRAPPSPRTRSRAICDLVLDENARRAPRGERPLYVMYDQVYWMLCFGGTTHVTPVGLRPEMAPYTVFVDGISKAFAATGVRVGWAVGPADVIARMSALLGHVGAWAPRAEQVATAELPRRPRGHPRLPRRLHPRPCRRASTACTAGCRPCARTASPVDSTPPMGAIYLTARIHPFGRRTPAGRVLETNEDVRQYLLDRAGLAVVPFQAFGSVEDDGWFRLSVGAVSEEDIEAVLPRVRDALSVLA